MGESRVTQAIDAYAAGSDLIEATIAGLPETALDLAPGPDAWSIRQILHHIADGDELWRLFVKRAQAQPGGEFTLEWYWTVPQDEWAHGWGYSERDVRLSLDVLRANRRQIVEMLRRSLSAWENSLLVRWPSGESRPVTVGDIVEMQTRHVAGHLDDIRSIRSANGV
jgi:uncharacterized damage-inducible protein DinB